MEENFSVINKTRSKLPSLPLQRIKNDILGEKYSLSVAFVTPMKSKELNKTYRKKDKPTNVLSFSLSKSTGELVLCPSVVKKEAKNFDRTYAQFLNFLVIHGMLHLKGLEHSSKMDRAEEHYSAKYDKKYFNRNRRGLDDDSGSRRRILKRRTKS